MYLKLILTTATVLAGAILTCGIAQATAIANLVITENSSTSLTATLTGTTATVTVTAAGNPNLEQWVLTFSGPVTGGTEWVEPGNPNSVNLVNPIAGFPEQLLVNSDVTVTTSAGGMTDGAKDTTDFKLNGGEMDVTFNDNGDAVPDATSTLPLLSLSLAGLGFLARRSSATKSPNGP